MLRADHLERSSMHDVNLRFLHPQPGHLDQLAITVNVGGGGVLYTSEEN